MIKVINITLVLVAILLPREVWADLDFTSNIQEILSTAQEAENKVQSQLEAVQKQLQSASLNRENLNKLKNLRNTAKNIGNTVKSQVKQTIDGVLTETRDKLINSQDFTIGGIISKLSNGGVTAELQEAVDENYTIKSGLNDDVAAMAAFKKQQNDLMVENTALKYGRALVLRKAIMDEDETLRQEEEDELTDLPTIIDAYKTVSTRASGRWNTILGFIASTETQNAQSIISASQIATTEKTDEESK